MRLRSLGVHTRGAVTLFLILCTSGLLAQSGSGTLRGQVADPTGAVVVHATVVVVTPVGQSLMAKTNREGVYEVKGLAPGSYTVKATAHGFAVCVKEGIEVIAGQVRELDMALSIEAQRQEVVVRDQATAVDVSPTSNSSALVMAEKDLDALSDDPDELDAELQALAGPSAGPNGGQIYIDGFTAGQLPPKSSIREIRINQNPFSAEYDKLGHGRIEIVTKSGADNLHGQLFLSGNSSAFNARNPFAATQPGYESTQFSGNVSGPLSKKASFFFNAERRDSNDSNVVSAFILDQSLNQIPFSEAVPNPRARTNLGSRVDYQLGKDNTLTVRYQFYNNTETNDGIGQFSLASYEGQPGGYNLSYTEDTLQASDTQILGAKTVNETRFQYIRDRTNQTPLDTRPTVSVLGAFTGGGSSLRNIADNLDRYELQNYTSMALGKHFLKFGGRMRAVSHLNDSTSGFNGVFTFASLTAYQITEQGLRDGQTPDQIRTAGGGASQFSIVSGLSRAGITVFDAGLYVQDDWRLRSNLTLSYGLRFETQNHIADHADLAPRVGIAWGVGGRKTSTPKTVIRAGFGMFYDRFAQNLVLQAERLNGITQQQFLVTSPDFFPNVPPTSTLTGAQTLPTIYRIDPRLHAPYTMQTAISIERQLSKSANVTASYLNSRGVHMLLSRNINAPDPSDPASGVRQFPDLGNIYEYESDGTFKQNQLIVNANIRTGSTLSLFGYYVLSHAESDTSGASSFPSNQYDLRADYGRAAFDIRHRVYLGGTISLPYALRLSPYLVASSGMPFDITLGHDLNGDSIFNDRPAFASTQSKPQNVAVTRWGAFDTAPTPGETLIPINYGTGPSRFTLNMRLSKTFSFGKKSEGTGADSSGRSERHGAGHEGRYSCTFSASATNIFNKVNLATPIGNLDSPLFGQSNALAGRPYSFPSANRRIDLQATFNF